MVLNYSKFGFIEVTFWHIILNLLNIFWFLLLLKLDFFQPQISVPIIHRAGVRRDGEQLLKCISTKKHIKEFNFFLFQNLWNIAEIEKLSRILTSSFEVSLTAVWIDVHACPGIYSKMEIDLQEDISQKHMAIAKKNKLFTWLLYLAPNMFVKLHFRNFYWKTDIPSDNPEDT